MASVPVLLLVINVAVPLSHVVEPLLPALTPLPHEKLLPRLFVTEKVGKVPSVGAVTVTVLVLVAAVTPAAAAHEAITDSRFEASVVVLESVAKVPLKVGAVPVQALVVPFVPAFGVPHKKMPAAFACVGEKADTLESPGVLPVTVTVLVLEAAVTPAAAGHKLIAAARFVAKVVVLLLVAKVPAVEVAHAFVPLPPTVTPPQEKLLGVVLLDAATEKVVKLPFVVSVTVTVLVLGDAVAPTAALAVLQALIAAARFAAKVVVLEAVTNVPVKFGAEPPHPAVPLVPAVTVPLHA